ncbi:uncharacterized protein A4U43_C05F31670 [Asparagus officinalis]|uniref:Cation-transporting P-type ATPase N-terminal domain-containing protein n=1 Tax=Asparagus officinalis TaxID=4686 RepID=A0A5P1EYG7_ASPOF|nr:uncharacterized protein A4U43_C05F31670 [Asparagus officinalis]
MEATLCDSKRFDQISVTLWGDLAEIEGLSLENLKDVKPVVALLSVIGEFQLSTNSSTLVLVNPEIPQYREMIDCREGLSNEAAQERLTIFGHNKLEEKQESKFLKFLGFMLNPLSWVMEAVAIMVIALARMRIIAILLYFLPSFRVEISIERLKTLWDIF